MSFHCNDTVMIAMCYWTGYLATVVEVPSGDDEYYTVSLVEQPEKLKSLLTKVCVCADKDIKKLQVCGRIVVAKKLFNVENTDVETLLAMMKKDSPESFDENGELVVSNSTMYELNGQQVYIPREVIDFQKDKDVEKNRTSNGHVTVRREDAPSVF